MAWAEDEARISRSTSCAIRRAHDILSDTAYPHITLIPISPLLVLSLTPSLPPWAIPSETPLTPAPFRALVQMFATASFSACHTRTVMHISNAEPQVRARMTVALSADP